MKSHGLALIVAGQLAFAATAPTPPPFTLESALRGIAQSHPQARRVAEELPPGVVAKENLPYAHPDGITLELDLYRPEGNDVCPAVIIVHGGGWVAGDRTMERSLARHLAARGYVAATVSYRLGEPGRFPNAILDLRTAVRWLRAHAGEFHLQPNRIGAIGGSAGGMLVTFLGATNGEPAYDPRTPEGAGSVQAVVNLAAARRMTTTAEGVETEEQQRVQRAQERIEVQRRGQPRCEGDQEGRREDCREVEGGAERGASPAGFGSEDVESS